MSFDAEISAAPVDALCRLCGTIDPAAEPGQPVLAFLAACREPQLAPPVRVGELLALPADTRADVAAVLGANPRLLPAQIDAAVRDAGGDALSSALAWHTGSGPAASALLRLARRYYADPLPVLGDLLRSLGGERRPIALSALSALPRDVAGDALTVLASFAGPRPELLDARAVRDELHHAGLHELLYEK